MNSEQGFRGVPGVPEGYELLRIDYPVKGETYARKGEVCEWVSVYQSDEAFPIVRKIEVPKQFRAFAGMEEFKPHRHLWWRWKDDSFSSMNAMPPAAYGVGGHFNESWEESFERKVFDDGSPFGVEITSENPAS